MPEPISASEAQAPPELEELSEPLEAGPASPPLAADVVLKAPDDRAFRVEKLLRAEGAFHLYEAEVEGDGEPAWLREALTPAAAERLRREARVLEGLDSRMLPQLLGCFESEGVTYLATRPLPESATLADLLAGPGVPLARVLTLLAQAAHALTRLHQRGWVHLGLRPGVFVLGKPLTVVDLSYATPVGERPPEPFYHAGYSAPELLGGEPVDVRADVYSLGAMLYHAANGSPVGEAGAELSTWKPPRPVAGVPQLLHRCLGPREERYASMEELHRDLLRLARRLAPRAGHALAAASSIGLEPTRTTNQDGYAYLSGRLESEAGPLAWSVACLADGMGGMAAGELASEVAVRSVLKEAAAALAGAAALSAEDQARLTRRWAAAANDAVCAALEARRARGGCTFLCACVVDRRLSVAHVGDCRLYRVRDGRAEQLTRDHSLAMVLAQQGQLKPEEVRHHPDRNKVTRSLGERRPLPDHFVDTLEQATRTLTLELQTGDLLLLCCDGLWEPVEEEAMLAILGRAEGRLNQAAEDLVQAALEAGGPDNATVVLLRLDETLPCNGDRHHADDRVQAAPQQPEVRDGRPPEGLRHAEVDPEAGAEPGPAAAGAGAGH